MSNKRFYWLKLQANFFTEPKIKKLRRIAGGDTFTIIYLKMQLFSIKNGGVLQYEGIEATFAEELALNLDEDVDNVQVTLSYLLAQGLIEEGEENSFLLPEAAKNIGSEGNSAQRVREFRERKEQKALHCNTAVTTCNTEKEKEKEIEIENREEKEKKNRETENAAPATSLPAGFGDELTDLDVQQGKKRTETVEFFIRRFGLPCNDFMRMQIGERLDSWGEEELKRTLEDAAQSNSRQTLSLAFIDAVHKGGGVKKVQQETTNPFLQYARELEEKQRRGERLESDNFGFY